MILTRFYIKEFNVQLLHQQLNSVLPDRIQSVAWPGFDFVGYKYIPIGATRVVATVTDALGNTIETTAEPGEVHFTVPEDFSVGEETTLDTALTNHDATQFTQEQQRRQQDAADMNMIRNLYDQPSLSAAELTQLVRLLARRALREYRSEAI